jgi:hypothetical protein
MCVPDLIGRPMVRPTNRIQNNAKSLGEQISRSIWRAVALARGHDRSTRLCSKKCKMPLLQQPSCQRPGAAGFLGGKLGCGSRPDTATLHVASVASGQWRNPRLQRLKSASGHTIPSTISPFLPLAGTGAGRNRECYPSSDARQVDVRLPVLLPGPAT